MTDLAVSVAIRTPWLGVFDIMAPDPVLMFVGEGGEHKITRRFHAACEARGIDPATLRARVCPRVPRLTSQTAMLGSRARLGSRRLTAHRPGQNRYRRSECV